MLLSYYIRRVRAALSPTMTQNKSIEDGPERLKRLSELILDLNVQWQVFDELYSPAANYAVFNRTGAAFWKHLWYHLLDDLFISISRFFDPARTKWQENLSLAAAMNFPEVAPIRKDLQHRLREMKPIWERGIKAWRHKKLSHNDMATALGKQTLPDVPLSEAQELVSKITDFVRQMEQQMNKCDASYRCSPTGWVPQVTRYLRLGIEKKDEQLRKRGPI